ncbi:futalosine hydrolase [Streptomyces spiramenti]|uniref:Futalosine hydrolase n=1 Tax=Streptomyces spiramenti TaxID=2720606 RepID=A0ABX1AMG8_9ACTN|nr:futalosine hydrolase [Streptomyces spiramenti]NJP67024.1 futalosine hydrolase [Streptomyces spiramenti]
MPRAGDPDGRRVLVVTAVEAERDAVAAGWPAVTAVAAGVGPAAAAAVTAAELTAALARGRPYGLVVSAGIGGGFAPDVPVGATAVATALIAADLGAVTADGFADVTALGFGAVSHEPPPELVREVAALTGAHTGPILTVSTVTGTAARAAELTARHPGAVAEAMEGFGVAEAATRAGVPVLEVRTVSNAVGPRDRAAWRIPDALRALTAAFRAAGPALTAQPPARPAGTDGGVHDTDATGPPVTGARTADATPPEEAP